MKQAATGFRRALDELSDELSQLEDRETLVAIKQHAATKGPSYWFRYYNFKAKKALDAASAKERYAKAYVGLEQAYNELDAWKKTAGGALEKPGFKAYLNMTDQFFNQAKKVQRIFGEGDVKRLRIESSQLVSWYNNLVNVGNTLRQMEAQGLL